MMDDRYYVKKYPQSVFRRTDAEAQAKEHVVLDYSLDYLPIQSEANKLVIRNKVAEAFAVVVEAILPPGLLDDQAKDKLVSKVWGQLGV